MKILSIFLTVMLILPIGYTLFSVYEMRLTQSMLTSSHLTNIVTWQMLSHIVVDLVFMVIALILNLKKKYLENSIMCGTVLVSFILNVTVNFATVFLLHWLK